MGRRPCGRSSGPGPTSGAAACGSRTANDLIPLVEQSDLFLDQRIQKTIHTLTPTQAEIRVDRSIVGEMMEDHGAPHLGRIYRDEVYKAICESYNPDIQVTVIQEDGSSRHTLRMTLA